MSQENSTPEQSGGGEVAQGGQPAATDVNQAEASSTSPQKPDVNSASTPSTEQGAKNAKPDLKDRISESLDKIRKQAQERKDSPPEGSKKDPVEKVSKPDAKTDAAEDPDDPASDAEKQAPVDIKDHPAFKQVISERKQARKERNRALKELETYKTDAQSHRKIRQFLDSAGVSNEDAAKALKMAALAYTNPQAFFTEVEKVYKEWGQHVGATLSPDLQKKVAEGYITQEDAEALSRSRAEAALAKTQVGAMQQRVTQQTVQQNAEALTRTASSWFDQTFKTDPDLERKVPLIKGRLHDILASEGEPASADIVWERLNRAYKEVNESLKHFQPAKTAVQPSPASSGTSRAPAQAPRNYEEAMQQAMRTVFK